MTKIQKVENKVFTTIGASCFANQDRCEYDFYATPPYAVKKLLEKLDEYKITNYLNFSENSDNYSGYIWEPCVGLGHISKVLADNNYKVICSDLIERKKVIHENISYIEGSQNFFQFSHNNLLNNDLYIPTDYGYSIITNPPYDKANKFTYHALKLLQKDKYLICLYKIQFLEGQDRYKLYKEFPPEYVFIFSKRIGCAKNGDFLIKENTEYIPSAVAYAWYIWRKGYTGKTIIDWIGD